MEIISIDFSKLPTEALNNLLQNDCNGTQPPILSLEAIVAICNILVERRRQEDPSSMPDLNKKWEEFWKWYMEDQGLADSLE